jgi:hypothetical protein
VTVHPVENPVHARSPEPVAPEGRHACRCGGYRRPNEAVQKPVHRGNEGRPVA